MQGLVFLPAGEAKRQQWQGVRSVLGERLNGKVLAEERVGWEKGDGRGWTSAFVEKEQLL